MKKAFLIFNLLLACTFSFALKKKKKKPEALSHLSSFYKYEQVGKRIIGNVYQFTVYANCTNIKIDTVWFGATPVPCDMYETNTFHKVDTIKIKGNYMVKANKDLYTNFKLQFDSTQMYKNFKPPFTFKKEAVLFYYLNGKRTYLQIDSVIKKEMKSLR